MSAYLTKELDQFNFKYEEPYKDILVLEDFLSDIEINEYMDAIKSVSEEDWSKEYTENLKRFCMVKFGRDDVENLVAEGKFEITQNWEDKNLVIRHTNVYEIVYRRLSELVEMADSTLELSGLATLQRMQPGVELKCHTDQDTDPSIHYATILYINDEYNGGELFFKHLNIEFKPKKGTLIIFPGTEAFHHGVRPVEEGPIRYVVVGFIKEKGHYEKNRY